MLIRITTEQQSLPTCHSTLMALRYPIGWVVAARLRITRAQHRAAAGVVAAGARWGTNAEQCGRCRGDAGGSGDGVWWAKRPAGAARWSAWWGGVSFKPASVDSRSFWLCVQYSGDVLLPQWAVYPLSV